MCIGSVSAGVFSELEELEELELLLELLELEELEELELLLLFELLLELEALPSSLAVLFEQALNRATSIRTATSRATILFVVIALTLPKKFITKRVAALWPD